MICQDCGQTFADKHKLAVHSQNHAKDEIKCHICEKICIGNKKFLNHIKLHQTFECENCGETVKLNSFHNLKSFFLLKPEHFSVI